jgi:hypothetical protein
MMELWEKFATETIEFRELLNKYLEMRLYFQELGYTQKQLSRISEAPPKLWKLKNDLDVLQDGLLKMIYSYGFDIKWNEFVEFLGPRYKKIDDITPLKDGDNEGTDNWDEDIE